MIFSAPVPFREALDSSEVRALLPTSLGTAELDELDVELRERALFSARTLNAEYLQEIEDTVRELIDGRTNPAAASQRLRAKLQELDIQPEEGKAGTIQDLGSDARLKVVLETNTRQAQGYGQWRQGQDPALLDGFPAQELFRLSKRKKPRAWAAIWQAAAARTQTAVAGFVALKNAPIWTAISRFGTPYPPFDFGSGMWTRNVPRAQAQALGLIDRDTRIEPQERGFNDDLQFTPAVRSQALRDALTASDPRLRFDDAGVLHRDARPVAIP